MTMTELAEEYRQSAALLYTRIKEHRVRLQTVPMGEMEKLRLRGRIDALCSMYRDTCETALIMERYYDGRFNKHGPFAL